MTLDQLRTLRITPGKQPTAEQLARSSGLHAAGPGSAPTGEGTHQKQSNYAANERQAAGRTFELDDHLDRLYDGRDEVGPAFGHDVVHWPAGPRSDGVAVKLVNNLVAPVHR